MYKIIQNTFILVALTFTLSGCLNSEIPDATLENVGSKITKPINYAAIEDIRKLIGQRDAEYAQFIKKSRQYGMYRGAARGVLLGAILDPDPFVIGGAAAVGGYIGAKGGEKAGVSFVAQHKNYTTRRWSLERIRHSVKEDTHDTHLDFLLTEKMKLAVKSFGNKGVTEKDLSSLILYEKKALSRAITLREVIETFDKDPAVQKLLEIQLAAQLAMIAGIRKNLSYLKIWV
tara:strand:+ start:207 stop:899 length:693 start_codon:yes stop_codon:yes gene_type:complete